VTWRIVYWIDPDAILVADWFDKKTQQTPRIVIERCRARVKESRPPWWADRRRIRSWP
jgi:phage-related protein